MTHPQSVVWVFRGCFVETNHNPPAPSFRAMCTGQMEAHCQTPGVCTEGARSGPTGAALWLQAQWTPTLNGQIWTRGDPLSSGGCLDLPDLAA